jgi:hypothetical protein
VFCAKETRNLAQYFLIMSRRIRANVVNIHAMWTPAFGIDKTLTWSSWCRVRVKVLQTRCYHMIRSTGGDETSSTAIRTAAMRWSLVNESSGLRHRISDNCAGHGNRQIPVQHPHDFGPELRAICFNTSVVPCLGSWKTHFKKRAVR